MRYLLIALLAGCAGSAPTMMETLKDLAPLAADALRMIAEETAEGLDESSAVCVVIDDDPQYVEIMCRAEKL